MNNKKLVTLAIATAAGAGIAMASTSSIAAANSKLEKAYGIAKAAKNDCGGKGTGHTCQGQSKINGDGNDWMLLPKGYCARIVGCHLEPKWKRDQKS